MPPAPALLATVVQDDDRAVLSDDDRAAPTTADGRLSVLLAAPAVVAYGADRPIALGVTTGSVVVLGLIPVWLPAVRRYAAAVPLLVLAAVAVVCGAWLSSWSGIDHGVSNRKALETVLLVVTAFGGVGLLLWARRLLPLHQVALLYGAGALLAAGVTARESVNPWKYHLALPVTILVLALVSRTRSSVPTVVSLCALGLVGVVFEYRSYLGFCVLALALARYGARRRRRARVLRRRSALLLLTGLPAGLYFLVTTLLVQGYLGEVLRQRSEQQIQESGSLLAGGRPEWTATLRLMQERPLGYGFGVVPDPRDVMTGKEGLATVGVPTNNGYVDNYMFGGQFKLHSVIADFWSTMGLVGLVLAVVVFVLLLNRLALSLTSRAVALLAFLLLNSLWDLAFGPLFSDLPTIALALGLSLPERAPTGRSRAPAR